MYMNIVMVYCDSLWIPTFMNKYYRFSIVSILAFSFMYFKCAYYTIQWKWLEFELAYCEVVGQHVSNYATETLRS